MGLNYGGSSTGPSSGGSGRLHCHCPRNSTLALFVLFFTLAISLILLILAGTLAGTWVPMINIISVVFVPMYAILADTMSQGYSSSAPIYDYDEKKIAWRNFGSCFIGLVAVSMLGLPLILLHQRTINNAGFAYWISSTFVACMGLALFKCFNPPRSAN